MAIPNSPSNLKYELQNNDVKIYFIPPTNTTVSNYEYTLDDGATYIPFNPPISTQPPTALKARYIKFEYEELNTADRYINLSGLRVYSTQNGTNIINSSMVATSLDVYPGGYPASNMLDNNDATIYHSNNVDNPWVQIDLLTLTDIYRVELVNRDTSGRIGGLIMRLYDQNQILIYTSNRITLKTGSDWYNNAGGYKYYVFWPSITTNNYGTDSLPYLNNILYKSYNITNLENGKQYDIKIRGINQNGNGVVSSSVNFTAATVIAQNVTNQIIPSNIKAVEIILIGGGGGGGGRGGAAWSNVGGGGGGGGSAGEIVRRIVRFNSNQVSYSVTLGSGGQGAAAYVVGVNGQPTIITFKNMINNSEKSIQSLGGVGGLAVNPAWIGGPGGVQPNTSQFNLTQISANGENGSSFPDYSGYGGRGGLGGKIVLNEFGTNDFSYGMGGNGGHGDNGNTGYKNWSSPILNGSNGSTGAVYIRYIYNYVPLKPINLSLAPQHLQLNIYLNQPNEERVESNVNYKYSLNGGPYQLLDPPQKVSPVHLVHPIVKVRSYNEIRLKATYNTIFDEQMDSEASEMVLGTVPCLLEGMKIKMKDGNYKPIEEIKKGDEIQDITGRNIIVECVTSTNVLGNWKNCPRKIPKDLFEANIPSEDIYISYNHMYFYNGWKLPNRTKGVFKDQKFIGQKFTYYHIGLPDYNNDKLVCHNLPVDSFNHSEHSHPEHSEPSE